VIERLKGSFIKRKNTLLRLLGTHSGIFPKNGLFYFLVKLTEFGGTSAIASLEDLKAAQKDLCYSMGFASSLPRGIVSFEAWDE